MRFVPQWRIVECTLRYLANFFNDIIMETASVYTKSNKIAGCKTEYNPVNFGQYEATIVYHCFCSPCDKQIQRSDHFDICVSKINYQR